MGGLGKANDVEVGGWMESAYTNFPFIQTFFPTRQANLGLCEWQPRWKKAFLPPPPQGLSQSPMWLNKPKTNSTIS